jgi:hypothetical protein
MTDEVMTINLRDSDFCFSFSCGLMMLAFVPLDVRRSLISCQIINVKCHLFSEQTVA